MNRLEAFFELSDCQDLDEEELAIFRTLKLLVYQLDEEEYSGPEQMAALRKLLEARDCIMRIIRRPGV